MTTWQSLLLGLVQGVTEFLPISSSGHLVIVQELLGVKGADVVFDVLLHVASLVSILIFFWTKITSLKVRHWVLLAVGTIPAAATGFLLKDWLNGTYSQMGTVPLELIASGFINVYIHRQLVGGARDDSARSSANTQGGARVASSSSGVGGLNKISILKSFKIGVAQAFALLPAVSRSGSTIAGGLWQGLDRDEAFSFAFLLAIPAIFGASALQLSDVLRTGSVEFTLQAGVVGFVSALIAGLLSLKLLATLMKSAKFMFFAWYCFILGGGLLALQLAGII